MQLAGYANMTTEHLRYFICVGDGICVLEDDDAWLVCADDELNPLPGRLSDSAFTTAGRTLL
eukprot:7081214-Karenia_brevis.AAC.1